MFRGVALFCLLWTCFSGSTQAAMQAGVGVADITPPVGTPSAGYSERRGVGMQGVHDPLLAIALYLSNGEKSIVLCSVDHLGFTHEMVQELAQKVKQHEGLAECELFIGSTHTHSGGGSYLNIPEIGARLAGDFRPEIVQFYINNAEKAIVQAFENRKGAKLGIGYGAAAGLNKYRAAWPQNVTPLAAITVIKVTNIDNSPLALLFNYPIHPTVLKSDNFLFSADFVGYTRSHLRRHLGLVSEPLYFNGAQGDIAPVILNQEDRFDACNQLGAALAHQVVSIWNQIETSEQLDIETLKVAYSFKPQATPFGLKLPVESYASEVNGLVLNREHAFITIPGELSTLYDRGLKVTGRQLGFPHVSILGLTNDAHGYIILPEAWRHKTMEASFSFGGELYGDEMAGRAERLLMALSPYKQQQLMNGRPEYLYKILSIDDWGASLEVIHLSAADEAFIHLSTEEQLQRIIEKYWSDIPQFVVLKLNSKELVGDLVYENNPGGTTRYYHLYHGYIPRFAVISATVITKTN